MKAGDRIVVTRDRQAEGLLDVASEGMRGVAIEVLTPKAPWNMGQEFWVLVRFDDDPDMVYRLGAEDVRVLDVVEQVGELHRDHP
jgi:hypothetical protein